MEYWDSKGQIYNDKQTVLSPLERAYNKALALGTNSLDWVNETNPESKAYKQKVNTILAIELGLLPLKNINTPAVNKALVDSIRRIKAGGNVFKKSQNDILNDEPDENILDLTGVFDKKPSSQDVKNYIQSLMQEGAIPTKSEDYLIDVPNIKKSLKHIQYPNGFEKMPREAKNEHNALALKLKEIIKNSQYQKPAPNKDIIGKPNIDSYHYFKVNAQDGEDKFPIILDTEQFIGESINKPQTLHLYNFRKMK